MDFSEKRRRAVEALRSEGILHDSRIARAMTAVPRELFLRAEEMPYAYVDSPLPIGHGQTTSALHMTALFCEYAEMKPGQNVLEVGGGCGYMSCVYAEVVAPNDQPEPEWGHVWSVEIIKELAEFARINVNKAGYASRVTVVHGDASVGLSEHGPYDVIIVTSAAPDIPTPLQEQIASGGVLLIPIGTPHFFQELFRIRKADNGKLTRENLGGVAFVPLRGKLGWRG
ncbi:MAG TPA: protein-L-isoaspartate(D-aspartate) O-methyltransferase [Candidatus Acidoferrum sp.]|nr:protein-L-isoaspartate(D-aspartate) O-methyltransferase [Candidatus Acidoferrum sp.]